MNVEVLKSIADVLEVESVSPEDILTDFDLWDSMAVLHVIAILEDVYHKQDVDGRAIFACRTVNDLVRLIQGE